MPDGREGWQDMMVPMGDAEDLLDWGVPLVEMACTTEDPDAQLEAVISRLEPELRAGLASAQAWHLLGLAWYEHSPCERRIAAAQEAFSKALTLEPDHQFALVYGGYLAFDEERFQDALGFFEKLDERYFRNVVDQVWRVLKTEELKICCWLRLGRLDALEAVPDWVQACEQFE
jgi:tetratricopeptide (TPR) repeat protein